MVIRPLSFEKSLLRGGSCAGRGFESTSPYRGFSGRAPCPFLPLDSCADAVSAYYSIVQYFVIATYVYMSYIIYHVPPIKYLIPQINISHITCYIYIYIYTYRYTYIRMYACMMHACMYVCMYVCISCRMPLKHASPHQSLGHEQVAWA